MIYAKLILYVSIGMATMMIPILIQSGWQNMLRRKGIVVALSGTVAGTIGTMILYWIENHRFGGTSFYGAVFAVPIIMLGVSHWLDESYERIMDLCAPAASAMLCVMKVQCLLSGCCEGRILYGKFRFPSQIAEFLSGLVIMVVLLALAKKRPGRGDLYPMYLTIYGCTRFLLNLLREKQDPFLLGMAAGNFWSIIAVIWGVVWLMIGYNKWRTDQQRPPYDSER